MNKGIDSSFYDEKYYGPGRGMWEEWTKIFRVLKDILDIHSVLDAGCGCASSIAQALDVGLDAHGIDFSEIAISLAFEKAKDKIEIGDLRAIPYPDNSFDLVLTSSVLEHIHGTEIDTVLSELARVSKKWIFFNIDGLEEHIAIAGYDRLAGGEHATIKPMGWWHKRLSEQMDINEFLTHKFIKLVPSSFHLDSLQFICEKRKKSKKLSLSEDLDILQTLKESGIIEKTFPTNDDWSYQEAESYFLFLYSLARCFNPKVLVECGTYYGISTLAFALGTTDSIIHAIDKEHQTDTIDYFSRFRNVTFHYGDALLISKSLLPDLSLDFVYLDADHTEKGTLEEFDIFQDVPIILIHDSHTNSEVASAIEKLIQKFSSRTFFKFDFLKGFTLSKKT